MREVCPLLASLLLSAIPIDEDRSLSLKLMNRDGGVSRIRAHTRRHRPLALAERRMYTVGTHFPSARASLHCCRWTTHQESVPCATVDDCGGVSPPAHRKCTLNALTSARRAHTPHAIGHASRHSARTRSADRIISPRSHSPVAGHARAHAPGPRPLCSPEVRSSVHAHCAPHRESSTVCQCESSCRAGGRGRLFTAVGPS